MSTRKQTGAKNAQPGNNAPTTDEDEGRIVKVIASDNRRRAGIRFPKGQAIPVNWDELTDEQREAIMKDPILKPAE